MSVSRRRRGEPVGRDADHTVVRLRGELDLSTTAEVTVALARALASDDADMVIDLSGVEFMGAETIGIIVRTRGYLEARSRSLTLRSPSRQGRRVIDICDLADLVDPHSIDPAPAPGAAGALGSWVAVPAADRVAPPVPAVGGGDVETEPARALVGLTSTVVPPTTNVARLRGP